LSFVKIQSTRDQGLKTAHFKGLKIRKRFFIPFLVTTVICLIISTSLTIKWGAFAAEEDTKKNREKTRATLANQEKE